MRSMIKSKIAQAADEAAAHIMAMDLEQFYGNRAPWVDATKEEQNEWQDAKDYIARFIRANFL